MKNTFYSIILMLVLMQLASCGVRNLPELANRSFTIDDEKGNHVQLKSGVEIPIPDGVYNEDASLILGKKKNIEVDGKRYSADQLKVIQIGEDYYRNLGKGQFGERIYKGDFDIYFNQGIVSTSSANPNGSVTYGTRIKNNTYIYKPNVNKGEPYLVKMRGQQSIMYDYVKSDPEAVKMLDTYHRKRKISRITKFASLGALITAFTLPYIAPGSTSSEVGAGLLVAGVTGLGVGLLGIDNKNAARPYRALDIYMTNADKEPKVSTYDSLVANKKEEFKQEEIVTSNKSINVLDTTTSDFLKFKDGTFVIANEGNKVRTNKENSFFMLNDVKYGNEVEAFQMSKRYFQQFPEYPTTTANGAYRMRVLNGDISLYSNIRKTFKGKGGIYLSNFKVRKDQEVFTNNKLGLKEVSYLKMEPMFADNQIATGMYSKFMKDFKSTKKVSTLLSITSIACAGIGAGVAISSVFQESSGTSVNKRAMIGSVLGGLGLGIGFGNYFYTIKKVRQLELDFIETVQYYNRTSK